MRINNNISALNAWRGLTNTDNSLSKSLEKLSSGLRINRAGDDAAGLAISEKMRGQIRGLNQAVRNAQDGISLIQTAEGALTETHAILQRMRELTVQSNNSTNTTDDLGEIQKEITELIGEINRIAGKTEFNTKSLLDGTLGVKVANTTDVPTTVEVSVSGVAAGSTINITVTDDEVTATLGGVAQTIALGSSVTDLAAGQVLDFDKIGLQLKAGDSAVALSGLNSKKVDTEGADAKFQIGPNTGTTLDVSITSMKAADIGQIATNTNITSLELVNIVDQANFDENLNTIDKAISDVSGQRSKLGAWQNRLEHTIKNLGVTAENLAAAESRIRDVDMAAEMMNFTKQNILMQAGTAMLAQANARPQSVLQLLG